LIESNKTEYTWIYRKEGAANVSRKRKPDTEKTTTTSITNNSEVDNLINKFE